MATKSISRDGSEAGLLIGAPDLWHGGGDAVAEFLASFAQSGSFPQGADGPNLTFANIGAPDSGGATPVQESDLGASPSFSAPSPEAGAAGAPSDGADPSPSNSATGDTPQGLPSDTFTATQTTVLATGGDVDGDGLFDPGDTVLTTVTITNNSATTDATVVAFSETLQGMTLVGTVNVSPIALNDAFNAVGNTTLRVGTVNNIGSGPSAFFSGNLLTNDVNAPGDGHTGFSIVTVTNGVSAHGSFNIFSDGSFNYISNAGFQGADAFTYTIRDAGFDGVANNADDLTSTATVTITVGGVNGEVWYVDTNALSDGTGTSANPFNTLSHFTGAGGASGGVGSDHNGDYVYLQGAATGNLTLEAGEHLVGTGSALVVGSNTLASAGSNSTISASSGTVVTLATDNDVRGVTIDANGNAVVGLADGGGSVTTTGNTFTATHISFTGTGQAIDIDQGGDLNVSIDSLTSSGSSGQGVQLSGSATSGTGLLSGTLGITSGAISGSTGAGFLIGDGVAGHGGTIAVSDGGTIAKTSAGNVVDVEGHTSGAVTFSGNISATGGFANGIVVNNNSGGTVTFSGAKTVNTGTSDAVTLTNNSGATINFTNGGLDIDTTSGHGFTATGGGTLSVSGSGNSIATTQAAGTALDLGNIQVGVNGITFATVDTTGANTGIQIATVTQAPSSSGIDILGGAITNAGTRGVDIDSTSADVTVNSTISTSATGRSVEVTNSGGGGSGSTIIFGGAINDSGTGISLDNNDASNGATINFTAGLTIHPVSGQAGFSATNGGTINVTGTNTIVTTSATALKVDHTNIGASNLTFQSISASGGTATGIFLDTTGNAGGLHVTGSGSAFSGGTIANISGTDGQTGTGIGIYLNSTKDVQLTQMNLHDFGNFGIRGTSVNGFTLANSTVNATASGTATNGTASGSPFDEGSISFGELTGTASITNSTIASGRTTDLSVVNTVNGSILNLTVSGTTFTGRGDFNSPSTSTVQEVLLKAGTNPGESPTINATFTGDTFTNNNARGLQVVANGAATVSLQVGTSAPGSGNTFNGMPAAMLDIDHNSTGNFDFNVRNNTFTVGSVGATVGASVPINIFNGTASGSGSLFQGRVLNNTITAQNNSGFDGITMTGSGPGTMTMLVSTNTLTTVGANGIAYTGAQNSSSNTANLTITNNTLTMPSPSAAFGIEVSAQASPTASATVNASITGNNVIGNTASQDYRVDARFGGATINMPGYVGGNSTTNMAAFVAANNKTNSATSTSADVSASLGLGNVGHFGNTPGGAAVTLPSNSQPLLASEPPPPHSAPLPAYDPNGSDLVDDGHLSPGGPAIVPISILTQPDPGPGAPVVDDGILTQAELNLIVDAAIGRWAAAGATADEIAAMRGVSFTVEDLAGLVLGSSIAGHVTVDSNAAGFNWFVDPTAGDDSEYSGSGSELHAAQGTIAGTRIDLLTTVMHELGHQIGLVDATATADRADLMYATIDPGERRLPTGDDVAHATGTPAAGTDFALSPINIGTLPAGQTVTIQWLATIDAQSNQHVVNLSNSGTVSATNALPAFPDVVTSVVATTIDTLTLSGTVWNDNGAGGGGINNGLKDGTEAGIDGVALSLFVDADNDNVPDPGSPLATTLTSGGGGYTFSNLAAGNYIVRVDSDNFDSGGNVSLLGKTSSPNSPDPDNNTDNDDNGFVSGGAAFSNAITLVNNAEPTSSGGPNHFNTNTTLDFGFVKLNLAPSFAALDGSPTPSFTEDMAPVVLDANATVTDPDLTGTNYAGASLTLARSGGAQAEDVFGTSGTLSFSAGHVLVGGGSTDVGTFTQSAGTLVITFNSNATQSLVNATLDQLTYSNTNQNPATSAVIAYVFNDGNNASLQGAGGPASVSGTVTVSITPVDDPALATADSASAFENATKDIDVLANDNDPDNPLSIVKINGNAISVGGTAILPSGATVKLEANGHLTYDPNHVFDQLTSTSGGEIGAVNTSAPDTFNYTLGGPGGGTGVVSVTVNGVVSVQDHLNGDGTNNSITGTIVGDFFDLSQGGNDTASGLDGNDAFYFGAAFTPADKVDGGAGANDQLGLQGNYAGGNKVIMGADSFVNVEVLVVLPGFSYDITTNDANVASGGLLKVQAIGLASGQSLTFNGAAEHDGAFLIFGGQGNDNFTGGDKNDAFYFGPNAYSAGDVVNGGPGTNDQLGLDGNYGAFGPAFTLGVNITAVETIVLLPGPAGTPNTFNITTSDVLVPATQTMTIFGLPVATDIRFDGSHEHDGAFRIFGGSGNDIITGSDGNDFIFGGGGGDTLDGGAGRDNFYYDDPSQSTSLGYDKLIGFDQSADTIDLPFTVTGLVTETPRSLDSASFNPDLAAAFTGLGANQAGLFTANGGDLAGHTFLVIDANGVAGYPPGSDYVIEIVTPVTPITDAGIFV